MKQQNSFNLKTNKRKLAKQQDLLQESLQSGVPLASVLKNNGWSYDDLQYESTELINSAEGRYFTLDDFRKKDNSIPVVSFFSGAGGLDLGFEAAGFAHNA